jgi:hypothetical protein
MHRDAISRRARLFRHARADLDKIDSASAFPDLLMLILTILAVLVIAGSFYADYKWRQWMAERRKERN